MRLLKNEDVSYLHPILVGENGIIRSVPSTVLKNIPGNHLHLFAHNYGIYQYVTDELIEWLKNEIKTDLTIEIGAGKGIISRCIGIVGTDSYLQQDNAIVRQYYEALKIPVTSPPKEIMKYEANTAVDVYLPHTVIGAFITQLGTEKQAAQGIQCSPYGVDESKMLSKIKRYIHIGNKFTHKGKHIFKLPHREFSFPWLVSRAFDQSLNRIWVWEF